MKDSVYEMIKYDHISDIFKYMGLILISGLFYFVPFLLQKIKFKPNQSKLKMEKIKENLITIF